MIWHLKTILREWVDLLSDVAIARDVDHRCKIKSQLSTILTTKMAD